ncbi:MAG: hypothetical protein GOU97_03325 [Nanoarchaeota archaeon]|nr:hypothetical protein [Nanoarchaeota archaeon]
MRQISTTLQFPKQMVRDMEYFIERGKYSSKSELVREGVRKVLSDLKKKEFYDTVHRLKTKSKKKGVRIQSLRFSQKESDEMLRNFIEKKGLEL